MSYDKEFKLQVLKHLEAGNTQEATAKLFGIGTTTLKRWKWQNGDGMSLEPKKRERKARKLPRECLRVYVENHPDAYLQEIGEHFGCTGEAVRRALKAMNITRQKRR
jgi:transposase-like protein